MVCGSSASFCDGSDAAAACLMRQDRAPTPRPPSTSKTSFREGCHIYRRPRLDFLTDCSGRLKLVILRTEDALTRPKRPVSCDIFPSILLVGLMNWFVVGFRAACPMLRCPDAVHAPSCCCWWCCCPFRTGTCSRRGLATWRGGTRKACLGSPKPKYENTTRSTIAGPFSGVK